MTKFEDQLYTDLMREHGSTLAETRLPAGSRRQFASRRVLLATGAGGLAVAATAGALAATTGAPAAGGGSSAYALTAGHDGTVTLAVYQTSGISQANAKLRELGDNVVVVPVRPGCPPINSLPKPPVLPNGKGEISVHASKSTDGTITVNAAGVPAGDILVIGAQVTAQGSTLAATLSAAPAPSCVSMPAPGASGLNVEHRAASGLKVVHGGGSGRNVAHPGGSGQNVPSKN
jgi:hypothetical protein